MNIPGQFQKIMIVPAQNPLIPVLKEMAVSLVSTVKIYHIPGQQLPHALREGLVSAPNQQVKMGVQQRPSINAQCLRLAKFSQTIQEILPVSSIPEDLTPFTSPAYNVMQGSRRIQSRLSCPAPKSNLP